MANGTCGMVLSLLSSKLLLKQQEMYLTITLIQMTKTMLSWSFMTKMERTKKTLRLPLNEGLAQITVVQGNTLSFNYAISKEGAGWASWNEPKAKPAKGEYIVTQSNNQLMVQVTPANYDLSGAELKIVDSKGPDCSR